MAENPSNHGAWTDTQVSAEALLAREASFFMRGRVLDKTSEVTGQKLQQIDIPEVEQMVTHPVGDDGGVTPQQNLATAISLVIDQEEEATKDIKRSLILQSVINAQAVYGMKAGIALARFVEDFLLALEVGTRCGTTSLVESPTTS